MIQKNVNKKFVITIEGDKDFTKAIQSIVFAATGVKHPITPKPIISGATKTTLKSQPKPPAPTGS